MALGCDKVFLKEFSERKEILNKILIRMTLTKISDLSDVCLSSSPANQGHSFEIMNGKIAYDFPGNKVI